MRNLRTAVLALIGAGIIAGCTGGGLFGTNNTTVGNPVFNPTNATLQLAVGTIHDPFGTWQFLLSQIYGTPAFISTNLVNAVATFRAPNGLSAFPNPAATPATLARPNGLSTRTIGSVFAYGQFQGTNAITGLPPAYPSAGAPAAGFPTGFMIRTNHFPIGTLPSASASGMYTLNVLVSQNGVSTPFSASAMLPVSPKILGTEPTPSCTEFGDGSGSCTLGAAPAGVIESLVVLFDNCNGAELGSAETTTTAPTVVAFPAGTFPGNCVGNEFAYAMGADYPLVEAGPPLSTTATPTITNSDPSPTANLTFSDFSGSF